MRAAASRGKKRDGNGKVVGWSTDEVSEFDQHDSPAASAVDDVLDTFAGVHARTTSSVAATSTSSAHAQSGQQQGPKGILKRPNRLSPGPGGAQVMPPAVLSPHVTAAAAAAAACASDRPANWSGEHDSAGYLGVGVRKESVSGSNAAQTEERGRAGEPDRVSDAGVAVSSGKPSQSSDRQTKGSRASPLPAPPPRQAIGRGGGNGGGGGKACFEFAQTGQCRRGAACRFMH